MEFVSEAIKICRILASNLCFPSFYSLKNRHLQMNFQPGLGTVNETAIQMAPIENVSLQWADKPGDLRKAVRFVER